MNFDINILIPNGPINTVFLVAIISLSVIDLSTFFSKKSNHIDFKSTIVSVGVLGTFFGVYLGLKDFDGSNISGSVPPLLEGLQTAFYTSISGMFFALSLAVIQKLNSKHSASDDESGILKEISQKLGTLDRIKANTESIEPTSKLVLSALHQIKDEIGNNNRDMSNFLKEEIEKIQESLNKATESLAKGATEEIIKALETVISDFNNNLTEQFGDNFKQLNESVINMVQWQENYRSSIEDLEVKLSEAMEVFDKSIENGKVLLDEIFENFKVNSEGLMESNKANQDELKKALDDVFDKFKTNSQSLMESNISSQELLQKHIENSSESISEVRNVISGLKDDFSSIAEMSNKLGTVIDTNQNQINSLQTHLESLSKIGKDAGEMTESIKGFSAEIQESLTSQSKSLAKMNQELDKQLPESLGKLNRSLTTLTEKFADDYGKFLELMAKLVNSK